MVQTVTTNVPGPTFGPNGFIEPAESAILSGVLEDFQLAFGGNLNPALNTPQGQLASSETAVIGNVNDTFLYYTQQVDPAYASGRMQDAIGRIYFIERNPSQPTVLQVVCLGLTGVVIPVNAQIQDAAGNSYVCTESGTIPPSGSITLPFANTVPGPIAVPESDAVSIFSSIPGWDTATVTSGVLGNDVEGREAFETRRALSVAQNSLGSLPSILGAVLSVPNVIDAFVTENDSNSPQTIGGYELVPNSLYVAVVGGEATAVAQAIWSRKAPGCAYNGNTNVTVLDQNSGYNPPYPSYSVSFETPTGLAILFAVSIANNSFVPANAAALIQNAIISAFAGGDGGPRARIGNELFASRFYAPIAALGSWVQIISIEIGSNNASSCVFVGSITGTALTVASVTSGALAIGQTISDATGNIVVGTTIVSGSGTSWVVSNSQTVTTETITSAVPNLFTVQSLINQVPTIAAANIAVTLV